MSFANAAVRIGILFMVFFNKMLLIFSPNAVMRGVLARFSAENAHSAWPIRVVAIHLEQCTFFDA